MFQAKFYGLGADGTVGANKNSVKIIGDNTDKYCQAYFSYDSKKSGGFTCSHLRFGDTPIRSTYLVTTPNFVACHVQAYLHMYDVTRGLQKNGQFLLNTIFDADELEKFMPNKVKRYFAQNNITVYTINATKIAQEIGLGNRTNTILQSAFFRITEVIPVELAVEKMKAAALKSYGAKGQDVVDKNYAAIDRGGEYKKRLARLPRLPTSTRLWLRSGLRTRTTLRRLRRLLQSFVLASPRAPLRAAQFARSSRLWITTWLSAVSGSSVATVLLTISVTAVSTT